MKTLLDYYLVMAQMNLEFAIEIFKDKETESFEDLQLMVEEIKAMRQRAVVAPSSGDHKP